MQNFQQPFSNQQQRFPLGDITSQSNQAFNVSEPQQQWNQHQPAFCGAPQFQNPQQFGFQQQPTQWTSFQPQQMQAPQFANPFAHQQQLSAPQGFGGFQQQPATMFKQTPQFVTTPGSTQFFSFNNNVYNQTADGHCDEDDDDEEYLGDDHSIDHGEDNMMDQDGDMMFQDDEEVKESGAQEGGDDSCDEDEDKALQECCVPEHNALQELQNEGQEQFNLEDYLKFRAKLELEEQMMQQMQMNNQASGQMEMI